ncbi:MAG: MBL fold metallo-hydrolase [Clostridia bacterium]|nr:MBL fold metallo-hydrolase [Clostridia bacterium]
MKITYIGQAGLLIEKDGVKILVDPYLSNSVVKVNPRNYRRQPVDESLLKINPDVIILTHDHIDHTDEETLIHYLGHETEKPILVLAGRNAYLKALKFKNYHNYIEFPPHTVWNEFGLEFKSVKAEHSDFEAIGVIITDKDKKYYITGDTLYNEDIFKDIPEDIYALFLPINGLGNNMNKTDASKFAKKVNAKYTVPFHVGMFDNFTADDFECKNKIIPEIYKEIIFK